LGTPRVLVVDDDRDLCDLLCDFLVEEGYAVTKAYGGQDAIDVSLRIYDQGHLAIVGEITAISQAWCLNRHDLEHCRLHQLVSMMP